MNNELVLQFAVKAVVFIAVGVAIMIAIRKRMAKTVLDTGNFQLTKWVLEQELADNPVPRPVQPKNLEKEKRKFYFMTALPILVILTVGVFGGFNRHDQNTRQFIPFIQTPMVGIVLVWAVVLVLLIYNLNKRIKQDLDLLATGEAVGARVLTINRHKNRFTIRVMYSFDGKIHERAYNDSFAFFRKKLQVLQPGDEVTVIVSAKDSTQIALYMDMHAEIQGVQVAFG